MEADQWREEQVMKWFETWGIEYFRELDIWDIDWGAGVNRPMSAMLP